MKRVSVVLLTIWLAFVFAFNVQAQGADSIWLSASAAAYKTGETVVVAVNAAAGTPVQGFTFQIRYDAACLKPINAVSQVPGMNGLPVPQISGQVDGSYASTTPQIVNGVLAEVYFQALKGCQTELILESAALAIRNAEGFAAPLPGVTIVGNSAALNIDSEAGVAQPIQQTGASLPLEPTIAAEPSPRSYGWVIGLLAMLLVGGAGVVLVQRLRNAPPTAGTPAAKSPAVNSTVAKPRSLMSPAVMKQVSPLSSNVAKVHFQRGPYAGKSFPLNKLPLFIGRDPRNDICLNDPHILNQHVKIFETSNGYYLMDLGGGETYVNGRMVQRNSVFLKSGDAVRLGKSALFVFGA